MERLRSISVSDGTTERRISLYHGDLLDLDATDPVDLLVASAFPGDYLPTESSLIGALHRAGVSVADLATDREIDLRATSGFWLSHQLGEHLGWRGARRLAVFEPLDLRSPPEAVGALFRGLFPFLSDQHDMSVAMPVLAAGDQGWSPLIMMDALLEAAVQWMKRGLPISDLRIFERDPRRIEGLLAVMHDWDGQGGLDPTLGRVMGRALGRGGGLPSAPGPLAPLHDVFLSFSSHNADAADAFKRELAAISPSSTVFDFRLSINVGASYQNEIDRAIEGCKKVVSILTPAYFASPECQEELNIARLRNKRAGFGLLLPIYWKSVTPDLPLWLQTLNQYVCTEERVGKMPDVARKVSDLL